MKTKFEGNAIIDRGGRRRIKDRRYRLVQLQPPDRRTGLRRRSGWDRRIHQDQTSLPDDRRRG